MASLALSECWKLFSVLCFQAFLRLFLKYIFFIKIPNLFQWQIRMFHWESIKDRPKMNFDRIKLQIVTRRYSNSHEDKKSWGKNHKLCHTPLYLMKVSWFRFNPREWFEYYFKQLSMSDLALWRTGKSLMPRNTEPPSYKTTFKLNHFYFSWLSEIMFTRVRQKAVNFASLCTFHRSKPYLINLFFGSHWNIFKMIQD